MSDLDYPQDLRYTANHEWIKELGDGLVRVGITAYAQDALGDVVYVSLPATGDVIAAGEAVGEVESTKSVSDIYAPVAGEVTDTNSDLDQTPELVNTDPYGDGWMYEVKLGDDGALGSLLDVEAYKEQLG